MGLWDASEQKPLSYTVWMRDEPDFSTLNSLRGGQCYLIFTTDACSKTFTGIPAAPRFTWRKATTTGEGFMNLAGVSVGGLETPLAAKYFGEGPFGSGKLYTVSGVDSAAPTFASSVVFGAPKVQNGKAYALTAERDGDWPGVVEVQSTAFNGGLDFAGGALQDSIAVRNRGTSKRVFRLTVVESVQGGESYPDGLMRKVAVSVAEATWSNVVAGASWEVELEPDEARSYMFAIDRTKLNATRRYGAVLQVEDLGDSRMRVRVPITVDATEPTTYPRGLWVGSVQLTHVSFGDDATKALPAAGAMKATVILYVARNGKTELLPHVALAEGSNGVTEVFYELDKARAVNANARRLTSIMLGTEKAPALDSRLGEGLFEGESGLTFRYVVGQNAVDNPFRHAFHPDHDGVNASYTGTAPDGDNIANYASGDIKPELWSVSNTVKFSWRDDTGKSTVAFSPEGISCGVVEWKVEGLKTAPILMRGVFAVKRVNDAEEVKE